MGLTDMDATHELSTGNVFADLNLPDSEQELVKAKLTVQIYRILKSRGLTQVEAARVLGTTQAQVSTLMRCKPVSVSVGRLMEFLTTPGQVIPVTISPARGPEAWGRSGVVEGVWPGASVAKGARVVSRSRRRRRTGGGTRSVG